MYAQRIVVTGGPGRVNDFTVLRGVPFTARVTGLNGTPQRWAVGIGTVSGQNIFNTSSTTIQNAVVNRNISGNTALISVGATNGNGVSRYLTVREPSCSSQLAATGSDCFISVTLNPEPVGATNYSWTVFPFVPFQGNGGRQIIITNARPKNIL